jgi:hypothetical protein
MTTDEWKEKAVRLSCGHEWMVDFVAQALAEAYRKGIEDAAKVTDHVYCARCFQEPIGELANSIPHTRIAEAIRKLSKEA